jgi:hypothetical protein
LGVLSCEAPISRGRGRFDRERQTGDHQHHALARGGEPLVGDAEQIAEAKTDGRLRVDAFADLVRDERDVELAAVHDPRELVGAGEDCLVRVAAEHAVADPHRDAIDDDRVDAVQRRETRGHVERLFDGGPLRWALGLVARDARRHVGVPRLRGREERDAATGWLDGDRVSALAAPRTAENEE